MRISLPTDSSNWPEIWQATYRVLEQSIAPLQLKAWIQPLELLGSRKQENGKQIFEFGVANDFSAQWLRDHHITAMEDALAQVTGEPAQIQFVIKQKVTTSPQVQDFQKEEPKERSHSIQIDETLKDPFSYRQIAIDPAFTFDSFVVGASNQFAHASAIAVSENPAQQYNPLFLYSSPGLGKTHLLHAIGNHILQKNPSSRVAYLSAESFVNELIESLQHHRMTKFRTKYRDSYDVLLIDDIQFIAGKKQTEEEFFHTFNALYGTKRQIVLTSDRPPKEIEKLEERIRTRFEWGLVADIQPPEIETRIAILKTKAERDDIYLPDDVATFLASHIKSNVRELEGTLIRLQAQASLTGAEISYEMAKQELRLSPDEQETKVSPTGIQEIVAKHFHLKLHELKSSSRAKNVSLPRQIAMYLVRKYTGMGWKQIGDYFEKDHTTIMHAYEKIEQGLESDEEIRDSVEAIQNRL